jgi:tRNA(Ile)-lysidine synthase
MDCFETKMLESINSNRLLEGRGRLLLAVSGGVDSTAMALALAVLRRAGRLASDLVIGHVNHGLRGAASDDDEAFVRRLAKRRQLPFVSERADVQGYAADCKLSIETAARTLRLGALVNQCGMMGCDAIVTAHHMDDQAETVVHRLMRGTGFRGLCGIRPVSVLHGVVFIRPMLAIRRSEIEDYCRRNGLTWCQDATNESLEPTRNRIRHVLLPQLRSRWAGVDEGLSKLSLECRRMQLRLEAEAAAVFERAAATQHPGSISLHRELLDECPPAVFYEIMHHTLEQLGVGLRDYTQQHFDAMRQLAQKTAGRHQFPGAVRIRVNKRTLTVERLSTGDKTEPLTTGA